MIYLIKADQNFDEDRSRAGALNMEVRFPWTQPRPEQRLKGQPEAFWNQMRAW